jgi:hypothetical protein
MNLLFMLFLILVLAVTIDIVSCNDKPSQRHGVDELPHFENGDMVIYYCFRKLYFYFFSHILFFLLSG